MSPFHWVNKACPELALEGRSLCTGRCIRVIFTRFKADAASSWYVIIAQWTVVAVSYAFNV